MRQVTGSLCSLDRTRTFYDRWALAYEQFTRRMLPLTGPRAEAATALAVEEGARIAEVGCGPGPNLPHLAPRMASYPESRYVGIDIAPRALARARSLAARAGWAEQMSVVHGDARDPPLRGPLDALLGSFVATIFPDPEPIIRRWFDLVRPGGRLVLLQTQSSSGRRRRLDPWYKLFLVLANPVELGSLRTNPPWEVLAEREAAVESAVTAHATTFRRRSFYGGLLTMLVATA